MSLVVKIYKKYWLAALLALAAFSLQPAIAVADTLTPEEAGIPEEDVLSYEWDPSTWEEPAISLIDVTYEGTAADIVTVAQAEPDGVPEGGRRNKYNNYNGEPWCAYFVVWCARQANVSADVIPAKYECGALSSFFREQGRWHAPSGYTPKVGDLIFYSQSSGGRACHVGIVTGVSDNKVYTREANTTGYKTKSHTRTVGASYVTGGWYIKGYATPNYVSHSHKYNQVADASYAPISDSATEHTITYIPQCACGAKAGITSKTETCKWKAVSVGYECRNCTRAYDMTQDGDRYLLFVDVAAEVAQKGAQNVWYVSQGWLDHAIEKGLMQGANTSSGCYFNPYADVTRAQVATILYRSACASDPTLDGVYGSTVDPAKYATVAAFSDAEGGVWYTAAISWAKAEGVMVGDGGAGSAQSAVRPNDPITREEMCLMLARYANDGAVPEMELDAAKAQGIQGLNQVSGWAEDGVIWAVNNDIVRGDGNSDGTSTMNPKSNTSRAAAAKMVSVVLEVMQDDSADGESTSLMGD